MIGVIVERVREAVVREFFELFKTPWEFYEEGRHYDVILCVADDRAAARIDARLKVIYASRRLLVDEKEQIALLMEKHPTVLSYRQCRIPVYGELATFESRGKCLLSDERSGRVAGFLEMCRKGSMARIGYDLFAEVTVLLSKGQPIENASCQTLESHISLLRDLIVECGLPLVEIPAIPDTYPFTVCLTHDMDHPAIQYHKWDHTVLGFLYRASIGTVIDYCRRRISVVDVLINWGAVVRLPLVYMGLAKDFWHQFHQYVEIDSGKYSTFFVIPFRDLRGQTATGEAPQVRASKYEARDIAGHLRILATAGCEIGLHGIDAWRDPARGWKEKCVVSEAAGVQVRGVRMHWLYFDEQSPAALENAGLSYDSSMGYNETVGYLAGTAQVFKPLQATELLELPLLIMDTALFFPSFLNLTADEAKAVVRRIIQNAEEGGGVVTINWHDRSLAPERLWGRFYSELVSEVKHRGAWLATAQQAVSWFRKRRDIVFETVDTTPQMLRVTVSNAYGSDLPGLRLRVHNSPQADGPRPFIDIPFTSTAEINIAS